MKRISIKALVFASVLYSALLLTCQPGLAWNRPGVTTDKTLYSQGEQIRVRFFGAPGYQGDWICLVPSGSPDNTAGTYEYLPYGVRKGFVTFIAPSPGRYEIRVYYNYRRNGYLVSARQSLVVKGQKEYREGKKVKRSFAHPGVWVTTNKNAYHQGGNIVVRFSGAPGYSSDWICIAPYGAPDNTAGDYKYMPSGIRRGTLNFYAPTPGRYEVRAYYNYRSNGYLVSARHPFEVRGQWSQGGVRTKNGFSQTHRGQELPPDLKLREAQYKLIELGYDPGAADGLYGRKTYRALKKFQRDNQLKQSGKLDRATLEALGLLQETTEEDLSGESIESN